jgi:predicted RNase H-like HicB family nuclease
MAAMTEPTGQITVTARYARDGNDWIVELDEEPRVHSFGRTLAKARESILDATALWYQVDARLIDVDGVWDLEGDLGEDVKAAVETRNEALNLEQTAAVQLQKAVLGLSRAGIPMRDIGGIFGISHQRVHQLLAGTGNAAVRTRGGLPGTETERTMQAEGLPFASPTEVGASRARHTG